MTDVAGRIRSLVDQFSGRSVRKAAAAVGMPHRTFARLVDGSATPRADALERIASVYGVDVNWLVRGVGHGPEPPAVDLPWPELLRWRQLVAAVALEDPLVADALARLPFAMVTATAALAPAMQLPSGRDHSVYNFSGPDHAALVEALRLGVQAWTLWLGGLLAEGRDAVKPRLVRDFDRLRLGYNDAAVDAYRDGARPTDERIRAFAKGRAARVASTDSVRWAAEVVGQHETVGSDRIQAATKAPTPQGPGRRRR